MTRGRTSIRREQPQHASAISTRTGFRLFWMRVWTSLRSRSNTGEERLQHGPSMSMRTRFGVLWKRTWTSMCLSGSGTSTEEERPQDDPSMSPYGTLANGIQTLSTSNPYPHYADQEQGEGEMFGPEEQPQDGPSCLGQGKDEQSVSEDQSQSELLFPVSAAQQGKEENPGPGNQSQDGPPLSDSAMQMDENKEMVITNIRARDVALGLRRLPAGFYIVVHHSGLEWRTNNKPSSANDDVEWNGPIPLPSDLTTSICLEIYGSFECQPMLGSGEQLRELTVTVEQLMDRSANEGSFTLFPKDGDVVSPCSSIFVTVKQRLCKGSDSSALKDICSPCSISEHQGELEDATNEGHCALSCYRKNGEKEELERSIAAFELALNIGLPNDPACRAVAESNLAMAKFIFCQIEGKDVSFEVPLGLYHNALAARPVGHVDRPSTLIQLAVVHLARFEKGGSEVERARAEALLGETMELSSAGTREKQVAAFLLQLSGERRMDPVLAGGQSTLEPNSTSRLTAEDPLILSAHMLARFHRFGDLAALQQAIALLEELVKSTVVRDTRYLAGLQNFGAALCHRFNRLGEVRDLEHAISTLKDAVDLTPHGHPDKPGCLNNLGTCFLTRFQHLGELSDLADAISTLRDAADLIPRDHPDKPGYLNSLGASLRTRFERLGALSDLEDAISTLRDAVNLTPHDHPDRPGRLTNFGNSLLTRFERLGELRDLEDAISAQRNAVDLTPHGHRHKPSCLSNLGNSFVTRFERLGEPSDLDRAISTQRDAVGLIPPDHPDKPSYLHNLGASLITRFKHLGELSDLEDAISTLRDAVDLTPQGHPEKPSCLYNLGASFITRFERHGNPSDLKDGISTLKDAVDLTPQGHPEKPNRLASLGTSVSIRFEHLGDPSDLEDAISTFRDAVNLIPHDHPDKSSLLNNLGASFKIRFEHLGELSDLEDAVSTLRDAVDLTPNDHPDKPDRLFNLGNSFLARFERLDELRDLEAAISRHKEAVNLIPNGHPDKPNHLHNLNSSLTSRFERLGELDDLERAISTAREAVGLAPHDDPYRPSYLHNLGTSLFIRFEHLGELSDLEDAISTLRNAVGLLTHAHGDVHKPGCLASLGSSLLARFTRLGDLSDLQDAILTHRDAVKLTPDGHPDKPSYLTTLGNSLQTRFLRLEEPSDLEAAISTLSNAVDLTPHGHPKKPIRLEILANCFLTRFNHLGEVHDIEDAISMHMDAVTLTPQGHPDKPRHLNQLGNSFLTRFERLGELSSLEDAISALKDAFNLVPHGHPDKLIILNNLGNVFLTRFNSLEELNDLQAAISFYSHAASTPIGPITDRFYASQKWILCARHIRHDSLLHAYTVAITLLPQLAWVGFSLTDRYSQLKRGVDVVREAAAAALDFGLPETAVEWLEQGRSIVWGDLLQLRSSYDELSSAHPEHARRLQELSIALDNAGAAREKSMSTLLDDTQDATDRVSLQDEVDRHRTLAIERDKLLREIRRFPSFERFLLQKQFSHLRTAAHAGPIVILNAAESRCDALIVLGDLDHVIHVPLTDFTLERCVNFQKMFHLCARAIRCNEREGEKVILDGVGWESLLAPLWRCVVKPVLDALAISSPGDLSRIFWCPTGHFVFLPIHAAGFYDATYSLPGHKVYDFVVSSYVPSVSILALSPNPSVVPSEDLRLLAVRQPSTDGQTRLPGVHTEVERIKSLVRDSPLAHTTLEESSLGSVEEVLGLMKETDWVHFACHGIQDRANPTESGLCLAYQRRLKITDIIGLSRPRGGLAFLSACQTATGDKDLTDEAIHIAAGMLFAGYGGVVGTMWAISDKIAPDVARDVYAHLFRDGTTRPDYREAAWALHDAVASLREDVDVPFDEWLPFIHVGL